MDHSHEPAAASSSATLTATAEASDDGGADRRRSPRRRLRDRIASLDSTANPALKGKYELKNLMLLVDDDLRQTALELGVVEAFLGRSMSLLEVTAPNAAEIREHAEDEALLDHLDALAENLGNLRRRMGLVAAAISPSRGPTL